MEQLQDIVIGMTGVEVGVPVLFRGELIGKITSYNPKTGTVMLSCNGKDIPLAAMAKPS